MSTRHILYKLKSAIAGGKIADSVDIDFSALSNAVYVSNSGDDTNDGLSANSPVATLQRANTLAAALPGDDPRWIRCDDGSEFGELNDTIIFSQNVNVWLPNATIAAGVSTVAGAAGHNFYKIYRNNSTMNIGAGDIYEVEYQGSVVNIGAANDDNTVVHIREMIDNGSITFGSSEGAVRIEVDHVYDGFTQPSVPSGLEVTGWIGNQQYPDMQTTLPDLSKVIYVSASGDDANDGLNISKPKQSILAALTAARAINGWVVCPDGSEFSVGALLLSNGDKIYAPNAKLNGDISGPASGAVDVIAHSHTGLLGIGTGDRFIFDNGNSAITIQGETHDDSFFRCGHFTGSLAYVPSAVGTIHLEIGFSNIDFASGKPNGLDLTGYVSDTFFGASGGGSGVQYTDGAGENNELVAKTGTDGQAKGSGIILNALGRIPFENIGEADITLSGSGGSLTIDVDNIDQYKNRTIFVNHSNTFTINLDSIADFNDANSGPFFLRFVQLTDKLLAVQGITGQTVGGLARQLIRENGTLTIELPSTGQTNWPVLAAGNPLRRFDIVQVTASQSFDTDAKLETICDHLLEVSGSDIFLSFAPSSLDCAFYVHNQGSSDVALQGISGVTFSGYDTLKAGDLVWVWNISQDSIYRSVKIGNSSEIIPIILPENTPIFDSLNIHQGIQPTGDTAERISIKPNWTGARSLRIRLTGGVIKTLGPITPIIGVIETIPFTITASEWATIYTSVTTNVQWWLEWDDDGSWEFIYSARVPT